MSENRRTFLKKSVLITGAAFTVAHSLYAMANADSAHIFAETLAKLSQGKKIAGSDKIVITMPKIAENGALVPISVETSLTDVQSIAIVVEKNPIPLAAKIELSPELEAFVSARLKMATSSNVLAIIATNNGIYQAQQYVSVTIGGCGD